LPTFSGEVRIEDIGQFPWHEQPSTKKISTSVASSVLEEASVLWRGHMLQEPVGHQPETTGQRSEEAEGAQHIHQLWNFAEARVSAKEFIATQPGKGCLQACLLRRKADEVGVHSVCRGLVH
jgi:hypothetical protein